MAAQLLGKVGLTLDTHGKENTGVIDLTERYAEVVGFRIRIISGEPRITLGPKAYGNLLQDLRETHMTPDSRKQARDVISGWIGSYGHAFREDRQRIAEKIKYLAEKADHHMLIPITEILGQMDKAWEGWVRVRDSVQTPEDPVEANRGNLSRGDLSEVPGRPGVEVTPEAGAGSGLLRDSIRPGLFFCD